MSGEQFQRMADERARRANEASAPVVDQLERDLVGSCLVAPDEIPSVLEICGPPDFQNPKLRVLFGRAAEMQANGAEITLSTLCDELDRAGELAKVGGIPDVAEAFDAVATGANALTFAKRVRRQRLWRDERLLHVQAAHDRDPSIWAELDAIHGKIEALGIGPHGTPIGLAAVGFTGVSLRATRDRPEEVSPLPGLLDSQPALHVLLGKPKTGKSTLALALARSWSLGVRPWPGAPELPGTHVLVISREQTATRIDGTLRRLSVFSDTGAHDAWTDRMTLIARDRALPPDGRALLTLAYDKIDALKIALLAARDAGDPFGLVVLDSLSRLKPPEIEERDNDGLSGWLDALADMSTSCGVYALLIHHVGHSTDPSRGEARSAGRGASAISAVAQVVWLLERLPGAPNQRRLKVDGNAVLEAEITLEVASESAEPGSIHYFRPCDPLVGHDPAALIGGDSITQTELAWRLEGRRPKNPGERPPGASSRLAKKLCSRWEKDQRIQVVKDGQKNLIRLASQNGV